MEGLPWRDRDGLSRNRVSRVLLSSPPSTQGTATREEGPLSPRRPAPSSEPDGQSESPICHRGEIEKETEKEEARG